jgi:iron(III) transport system permease protein
MSIDLRSGSRFFTIATTLVVGTISLLSIGPIIWLFTGSLLDAPPGKPAQLTPSNYISILFSAEFSQVLFNTLIYIFGSTLLSVSIATLMAILVVLTDIPHKRLLEILIILPYVLPMSLLSLGYIFLFSPRIGFVNAFLTETFNMTSPLFNIYSLAGMTWLTGVFEIPIAFIMIASSLRMMDYSYIESAKICGASILKLYLNTLLPIMRPTILAVIFLNIVRSLEIFDIPAFVGIPANVWVMPTYVYKIATQGYFTDIGRASAVGVLFMSVAVLFVLLYRHYTKKAYRFITIGQRGFRPGIQSLGKWKYPALIALLSFLIITFFIPVFIVVLVSFMPVLRVPSIESFSKLTIENYVKLWSYPAIERAFINTFFISFFGATVGIVLLFTAAYIIARWRSKISVFLESIIFMPFSVPGIVIALGFVWYYINLPIGLYGTIWALILAYITRFMPLGYRPISSNLVQLDPELEGAARVCGASLPRTLLSITSRLVRNGLFAGWFLLAILFMRELGVSILLSKTGSEVLAVIFYDLYGFGFWSQLSALGTIMLTASIILYVVSSRLSRGINIVE